MKTILKIMFYTIFALLIVWIAYSWYDVVNHQPMGGTDWAWNFFNMAFPK